MQQKTNHLVGFLQDRDEAANNPLAAILGAAGASLAVQRAASQQPSASQTAGEDDDAAGESDDAVGEDDDLGGGSTGEKTLPGGHPNGLTPDVGASRRATSVGSASGDRRVNGHGKANGEVTVSNVTGYQLTPAGSFSSQSSGEPGAHACPCEVTVLDDPLSARLTEPAWTFLFRQGQGARHPVRQRAPVLVPSVSYRGRGRQVGGILVGRSEQR